MTADGDTGLDVLRARRRTDFPIVRDVPTRWADHDTYGHVNNAINYVMMDTAINGWLIDASGVDIREMSELGVVVETQCQYYAELTFPMNVTVGIALEGTSKSSVRYVVGFFIDGRDEPVSCARFVHVYIDRETRRPVSIPAPIDRALAALRI